MTARMRFDQQLAELSSRVLDMSQLVKEAIEGASRAVEYGDMRGAQAIISGDEDVNHAERQIESMCLRLIMEQQPVATDLRDISAAIKMITDLERIGDQACDICEVVSRLPGGVHSAGVEHLAAMSETVVCMVADAIDAYAERNLGKAQSVHGEDDVVDKLFDQVRLEIVSAVRRGTPDADTALDLFLIAKYLERIGDHAENIAEWAEYAITGTYKGEVL